VSADSDSFKFLSFKEPALPNMLTFCEPAIPSHHHALLEEELSPACSLSTSPIFNEINQTCFTSKLCCHKTLRQLWYQQGTVFLREPILEQRSFVTLPWNSVKRRAHDSSYVSRNFAPFVYLYCRKKFGNVHNQETQ
jgi:hypothetical protein